jgi:DNA-binding GntR family transcriptional regulator
MRLLIAISLMLGALAAPTLAQQMTEEEQEQLENLIELQQQSLESYDVMVKSLPTVSGFLNSMVDVLDKADDMNKEQNDIIQAKTAELEARVEEVMALLDAGNKSRAKLKALSIKWTPIGKRDIDKERTEHFENIRKEALEIISNS